MRNFIEGAGGGSSKSGSVAANTLFSDTKATVAIAYSAGPVVPVGTKPDGTTDQAGKSLYFGDTPLMNADQSLNFQGVTTAFREGTPSQAGLGLPAINKIENTQSLNASLKVSTPLVYRISDTSAQAAEVTITLPQGLLDGTDSNGNVRSTSVSTSIDLQENGGGWVTVRNDQISGKTDAPFSRSYRVNLSAGKGPWDIRVKRVTSDSNNTKLRNATTVTQVDTVKWADLTYPNTALVGVSHLASKFGGATQIGIQTYGRIIRVPTGYNAVTRSYPTLWDGTFASSWTDNPVWVALDLLTDNQVGLGLPDSVIDFATFYDIAKHCDELVSDGLGSTEPRYSFNGQITQAEEPATLLPKIASIWRGNIYAQGSIVTATCDKPSDPGLIVNPTNVIDGRFTWSSTSQNQRSSVFKVRWIDPSRGYKEAVEVVTDPDLLRELGHKEHSIDMPFCTSQGQANRAARWGLYTQKHETEIVTYQAGLDHFLKTGGAVFPGQIILLRDPARVGTDGLHGRLKSAASDRVVLDRDVTFASGLTYQLEIAGTDGKLRSVPVTQQDATTLLGAFNFTIPSDAVWLLTWSAGEAEKVRVLSVHWEDKLTATVTAVKHNASKYAFIEQGVALEVPSASLLPTGAIKPASGIEMVGSLYASAAGPKAIVAISWTNSPDTRVDRYDVEVLGPGEAVANVYTDVATNRLELDNQRDGDYKVTVTAKTPLGIKSVPVSRQQTLTIFALPPGDVKGFNGDIGDGTLQLMWLENSDVDLLKYQIRYSSQTVNASWQTSATIAEVAKAVSAKQFDGRSGTYFIKAIDTSGIESLNEAKIIVPESTFKNINVVQQFSEGPSFLGQHSGTIARGINASGDDGADKLQMQGSGLIESWESLASVPLLEGYYPESAYYQMKLGGSDYFDLGQVFTKTHVSAQVTSRDYAARYIIDAWGVLQTMGTLEGDGRQGDTGVGFEVSTTDDDPSQTSASWSAWQTLTPGGYAARAFKLRLKLSTKNKIITPAISKISVSFDMQDRVVQVKNYSIPVGGGYVSLTPAFRGDDIHVVQGPQNLPSGAQISVTNKSKSGFRVEAVGASQPVIIDLTVSGYGKEKT